MKKLLIASTALIAVAGAAAAETGVKIGGMGRFGLVNYSGNGPGVSDTRVDARLRFNIDATTETDSGVTFGGRIRMQWDDGATNAGLSAARLNVGYEGLNVEVGNANTAFDSAALLYNSEIGYVSSSSGNSRSNFYSFSSGALPGTDYMGLFASYSMNGFTGMVSYATPDQSTSTNVDEELSIALAYENDQFAVSAAYADSGAGVDGNDVWFLGGAYKGLANTTIGLNYIDEGIDGAGVSLGSTIVAYAHYNMNNGVTLKGYISNNDYVGNSTDTAYGIGADYDLGGATLAGGVQRDYAEETYVDFGVRFDF